MYGKCPGILIVSGERAGVGRGGMGVWIRKMRSWGRGKLVRSGAGFVLVWVEVRVDFVVSGTGIGSYPFVA